MKTIAIIGAGPSGLVAAKTFLRSRTCQYKVQIFEKTSEIGGLWGVYKDCPYDGMLNPEMPTNLSRFNIGFSDLAWSSVGLEGHVPYWPKAWQVGQYLRAYTERYIPKDVISFNTKVTFADLETTEGTPMWRLRWERFEHGTAPDKQEGLFDHVIVASGFFGTSSSPDLSVLEKSEVKVAHSTKLRHLSDVVPENSTSGTILVVGGGMSGADATTVLASQLSNAMYGPTSDRDRYKDFKLIQVCPEAAYALPLAAPPPYNKSYEAAPTFMPLDLCMYDLGTRPPGDIEVSFGKMPVEVIQMVHGAFQYIIGGDQSELGVPNLTYKENKKAAYVTLTEQYSGFIRSGNIKILTGRLEQFYLKNGSKQIQATTRHNGETTTIDDIVGVVFATGFSPQPSLDFLGPQAQSLLEYDPKMNRLPIILDQHATLSGGAPGLAVIGFHEGAFWSSMEMESRLAEQRWSNPDSETSTASTSVRSTLKDLRVAMKNKQDDVPQYWLGDYVGFIETLAREASVTRNDFDWTPRTGPVASARYTNDTDDQQEANKTLTEYLSVLHRSKTEGLFVARAAFLAMQGYWTVSRNITSHLATMSSGSLSGTASFHPRAPTEKDYDFEYLYTESGTFTMTNGLSMQATRQYVYRYQESTDKITVWFVKADGRTVDYLYHGLAFDVEDREDGWVARADHLCIKDMYESGYRFKFKGANVGRFSVVHKVKGPKKDYVMETWYSRG